MDPQEGSTAVSWDEYGERRAPQYALVFEEARRSLDAQERALEQLRTRAGTLIAAAAIVTSFLGQAAFDRPPVGWTGGAAVLGFVGLVLAVAWILLPATWTFRPGTQRLLKEWVEAQQPASLPEMHRGLAERMDGWYRDNERQLNNRYNAFVAASVLLVVEIVAWLVELL